MTNEKAARSKELLNLTATGFLLSLSLSLHCAFVNGPAASRWM